MKNDPSIDRLPPHSHEAEQGVLGCCLVDPKSSLGETFEKLKTPQAFYDARHQTLFGLLMELSEAGRPIDLITVQAALRDMDRLEGMGGITYLTALTDATPSAANLPAYLEIVREKFMLRRLLSTCTAAAVAIYDGAEAGQTFDDIEREILAINQARVCSRESSIRDVILRTIDTIEDYQRGKAQMRGYSSGFDYLDKMTTGFAPGQLIVLAARPGLGKTSLAMNFAEHAAIEQKLPVAVFSLEMTAEELGARLMFQRGRCDFQRFRTGFLENDDIPKLTRVGVELGKSAMWIDDSGDVTVMELRAKARRLHAQHAIKLIIIDYLQLIRGNNRYNNREAEVADISRSLKALAKELSIPVIVLAQLNRELEKDRNRMPRLSDLRESGSIEQDADLVMMLYEPRINEEEQERSDWSAHSRRINLLIAKQRNGPTGNVEMLFHKASMRFYPFLRSK